jgi:hypothetical protein
MPQENLIPVAHQVYPQVQHLGPNVVQNTIPNANKEQEQGPKYNIGDETCCCVCLDKRFDTLFEPCRHLCCCRDCANQLNSKECPICKAQIERVINVFFP